MKKVPMSLFIGYLVFISVKTFKQPVSNQEMLILSILGIVMISFRIINHLHRVNYKKLEFMKMELELRKPIEVDSEIAKLQKENEIESLKLKKFITAQEFSRREVSKTIESNGGMRF